MSTPAERAIAALLRAREDYKAQDNPDALAAAEKRLASLGYKEPAKKAAAEKTSAAPRGRTSKASRQSTAAK